MNRRVKRRVELLLRRSSVSLGMIKPTRLKNEDIIMVREANEMVRRNFKNKKVFWMNVN